MPRILVVNQYAFPREYGGLTRNIDLFSRAKRWRATILATSRNHYDGGIMVTADPHFVLLPLPGYEGNGIMRIVGWGLFSVEAFAVGLFRKADIVMSSSPHLFAAYVGLMLARIKRVPFVLEVRDLWPESVVSAGYLRPGSLLHRILVGLERALYKPAERIICVTTGWDDHFRDLGIDTSKLVVIPNGSDPADFVVTEARDDLRAEYGIEGCTAIFAGAHGPKDGISLILDAAAQTPEVNFLLVGDGSTKQDMVARAKAEGLTNVTFRDKIGKTELPRLLAACDLGLHVVAPLPVFDKGMSPNKLFDYIAVGLPVVSNARLGLRTVISDGDIGPVVEPDGLAKGISRVLAASPEELARWREHGAEMLATTYSRAANAGRLEDVLDEVLAQSRH